VYFQIVDNNEKCLKVFVRNELVDYEDSIQMTRTWRHSIHLKNRDNVDYAYLYTSDGDVNSACPGFVQESWESSSNRISAIVKSAMDSKCDLENNCIYDFIPENFLRDFLSNKQAIIRHCIENMKKPSHYDILRKAHILTEEMNAKRNLYKGELKRTSYNIFGTKTGRLSNAKAEIPILTLKKGDRHLLRPTNDFFLELDFNAAELRTLLALSEKQQPDEDIHEWTSQKLGLTREEIKKRTFAWLYNPEASDSLLEGLYERNTVKDLYYDGTSVRTPFSRQIETDNRRALNYIVQSTSSDICIEQAFRLRDLFKDNETKICYLMHDSVILDCKKEDKQKMLEARRIFGDTRLGQYRVNMSIGKNFGEMNKI
jgi:hypothetical protein